MPPEFVTDPLSDRYHRAHRAYSVVSALLLAWEILGLQLELAPVEPFKIRLQNQETIPYVLVALVLYHGFRVTLEWYQVSPGRRRVPASKLDFALAHLIGCIALGLYIIQTAIPIRGRDYPRTLRLMMFLYGVMIPAVFYTFQHQYRQSQQRFGKVLTVVLGVLLSLFVIPVTVYVLATFGPSDQQLIVVFVIGLALSVGLSVWARLLIPSAAETPTGRGDEGEQGPGGQNAG